MPKRIIDFELDFANRDIIPKFSIKQFDDAIFNILLKDDGIDYDATGLSVKLYIGFLNEVYLQEDNIVIDNNIVTIELDQNMISKNGVAYAELELSDGDTKITTSTFLFNVTDKVGEGATIPGGVEGFIERYEKIVSEFKNS